MKYALRRPPTFGWITITLLACAGCAGAGAPTSMGILRAQWTPSDGPRQSVPFSYEGEGTTTGLLFTTLGKGGEQFRGSYVFVEASTKSHVVTAVFTGWSSPQWTTWERAPDGQWTAEASGFAEFGRLYTNKVVAYLPGSKGHAMRCRFTLTRPEGGFVKGGRGECQISDGGTVELTF